MYQSEKATGAVRKGKRTKTRPTSPAAIVATSMRNQLPLTQMWYPRYDLGLPLGPDPREELQRVDGERDHAHGHVFGSFVASEGQSPPSAPSGPRRETCQGIARRSSSVIR
jgi:hypothetical protein